MFHAVCAWIVPPRVCLSVSTPLYYLLNHVIFLSLNFCPSVQRILVHLGENVSRKTSNSF